MQNANQNGKLLAAVDLGSNSFRLEIGRLDHGQIQRVEYLKETVRQGNGLDENRNLTQEAMQRGWECLARFGEKLAGFKRSQVRAVATQTLREARNRDVFLKKAGEILGFQIDVISGREEARLIYQGVARLLPQSNEKRLVVDIGGRSTEIILGQGFTANATESYRVGSVAWSMKYFQDGQFTERAFQMAETAAKAVLDGALDIYQPGTWEVAYGSSGTVGAVADILGGAGFPEGVVTREGLDWLLDRLIKSQSADKAKFERLKEDRRAVIGGGVSVLLAVFDLLGIEEMHAAQGALRHGAIYDLLDRERDEGDLRSASVQRLATQFAVVQTQALRVDKVSRQLFRQIHRAQPGDDSTRPERKLEWAAQLHEIGRQISHSDYHKHGAYILEHTDAPGFAVPELHRLGLLVLGHRGKLKKIETELNDPLLVQQLLSLRLAVILCHARMDPDMNSLRISVDDRHESVFVMTSRAGWSASYPQSAYLLREEVLAWQKTPYTFQFDEG